MTILSILMPIYNNEKTLQRSIDSIISQMTESCELILVDDGSTDRSDKICDEYAAKDIRIHVIHKSNEGALLTRRKALREAKGMYVWFPDGDDYLMENAIERVLEAIKQYQTDLVCFDSYRVDAKTQKKTIIRQLPDLKVKEPTVVDVNTIRLQIAQGNTAGTLNLKAIKRSVFDLEMDYSHWKNRICVSNDLFQVLPIIDRAQNAVYLPEPLYCYVKAKGSLTTSVRPEKVNAYYEVIKRREPLLRKWGISETDIYKSRARTLGSIVSQIRDGYLEWKRSDDKTVFQNMLMTVAEFDELKTIYFELKESGYKIPRKTRYILDLTFSKRFFLLNMVLKISGGR